MADMTIKVMQSGGNGVRGWNAVVLGGSGVCAAL